MRKDRIRSCALAAAVTGSLLVGGTGAAGAEASADRGARHQAAPTTVLRTSTAQVGVGRWRQLRIGMTVDAAVATGMVTRHAPVCGPIGLRPAWAKRGWVSFSPASRLRMMAVWSPREHARGGTGVGSTVAEISAAYPGLRSVRYREVEGYSIPFMFVRVGARTLTFQFDADTEPTADTMVHVMVLGGKWPQVLWEAC